MQRPRVVVTISDRFNYRRSIDRRLQARAQNESKLLAKRSFEENQRRWKRNPNLGHPIGVPPGYIGGTGCSGPGGSGVIYTCEPDTNLTLVAEAVSKSPVDGTWYASRVWKIR